MSNIKPVSDLRNDEFAVDIDEDERQQAILNLLSEIEMAERSVEEHDWLTQEKVERELMSDI